VTQVVIPAGLGFVADEATSDLPEGTWSLVSNMVFRDGYATKAEGYAAVLTQPSAKAYNVASYPAGNKRWWLHSTLAATFSDDGTTKTNITGAAHTGNEDNRFTSTVLGGVYVQNNQADVPQWWGGTGTLAGLTGWNAAWRCKALRSFKAYLVALNVTKGATNYGSMIKWSHRADPGTLPASWDEADATKDAGEADLSDTPDVLVDALQLSDTLVLYKERSAYALQFIGGNDIFKATRLPGEYGMLTQNCGAVTPLGHVVLTAGPDVVLHNGNEPKSILQGRVRRWLASSMDSSNFGRCFVVPVLAKSEVWICFPESGQVACTKALVWNFVQDSFGVVDLPSATAAGVGPLAFVADTTWDGLTPATWDAWLGSWNAVDISLADKRVIMASDVPGLYLMNRGDQAGSAAIPATLQRAGMSFGDPDAVKMLRCVTPRFEGAAGTSVLIQAGASMDAEQSPAWGPAVSYTIGTSRKADLFATGRFLALRIMSAGSGQWRLKSLSCDIKPAGRF